MGWLILAAYVAVGVQAFRLVLRRVLATWPALGLTRGDVAMTAVLCVLWPLTLPLAYLTFQPPSEPVRLERLERWVRKGH